MTLQEVKERINKFNVLPKEGMYASQGSVADNIHCAMLLQRCLYDMIFDYLNLLLGGTEDNLLFEDITTDYYDNSLELQEVQNKLEITEEFKQAVFELGFDRCWINYQDKTEYYFSKEGK